MMNKEDIVFCPWCGEPLELGTFHSRGGNYFLPQNQSNPTWYSHSAMNKRNAIMLPPSSFSLLPFEWPTAYVCRHCQKIIIPYLQQNTSE